MPPGGQWRAAERALGTIPNFAPPPCLHWGAWLGWGPYPATRIVLLFKHVLRGGGAGGGHTQLPRSWENATAARPAAPPANKAPAGRGIRAAHCRARAASWGTRTAPWGPGPASKDTQYLLPPASSGLHPLHAQGRKMKMPHLEGI